MLVPVQVNLDDWEDENYIIECHLRELAISSKFSEQSSKTLGSVMTSSISVRLKPTATGASINGVPIYTMGGDTIRIKNNVYDLTPEIHKALYSTSYNGKKIQEDGAF